MNRKYAQHKHHQKLVYILTQFLGLVMSPFFHRDSSIVIILGFLAHIRVQKK